MLEAVPEKVLQRICTQIPLARLGRADEVARVVHFLCADASSYITGQIWGASTAGWTCDLFVPPS
jgi:acetoacetyl-CoA reductase/3-oxoacyl-[acyl-carrier protein] reductase